MSYPSMLNPDRFTAPLAAVLLVLSLAACTPQGEASGNLDQEASQQHERCASDSQQVGDNVKHGVITTYGPLREQGPVPLAQQTDDATAQESPATHRSLRHEVPVPSGLSYTDCSASNQLSDEELDLDLEVLRPDERLREIGSSCVNRPVQDWLTNAPVFNTGALMNSLLQMLQRLEDLIDELTGRSC